MAERKNLMLEKRENKSQEIILEGLKLKQPIFTYKNKKDI